VLAKSAAVLLGLAFLASACGSRIDYSGGLRATAPSPPQEKAIARYASQNLASNLGSGDGYATSKVGCAFASMATTPLTGNGLLVYGQALCQTCPPATTGEVLPVVVRLDGNTVLSAEGVTAAGDPEFQNQVDRLFPKPLRRAAIAQNLPNVGQLETEAHDEGRCS